MAWSSASALRFRGLVIKFGPLALWGKNLLLCRVKYFSLYIYIACPSGKGILSCILSLHLLAFLAGRSWREDISASTVLHPYKHPEGKQHVAISVAEKSCVAIQMSLLEHVWHFVFKPQILLEHPHQPLCWGGLLPALVSLKCVIRDSWMLCSGGKIDLGEPKGTVATSLSHGW